MDCRPPTSSLAAVPIVLVLPSSVFIHPLTLCAALSCLQRGISQPSRVSCAMLHAESPSVGKHLERSSSGSSRGVPLEKGGKVESSLIKH